MSYFNDYTTKKRVTYNIHDDAFDPQRVSIDSSRTDYKVKTYGGFKRTGYLDNDDNYARLSLRIHNVNMVVNKLENETETGKKINYSLIVKLDMTNDNHRTVVTKLKRMYDHVFALIANRDADPHLTLKPFGSKVMDTLCKKKKLTDSEQQTLDDEVFRAFDFERLVKGLEVDSDDQPLPSCTPVLFLTIPWSSTFKATLSDITGDSWTPESLIKKRLTGGVCLQVGILSFTGKGVKWHLDANLVHIKKIEVSNMHQDDLDAFEEDTTEDDKRAMLEVKKVLKSAPQQSDSPPNDSENGISDNDEFPDDGFGGVEMED